MSEHSGEIRKNVIQLLNDMVKLIKTAKWSSKDKDLHNLSTVLDYIKDRDHNAIFSKKLELLAIIIRKEKNSRGDLESVRDGLKKSNPIEIGNSDSRTNKFKEAYTEKTENIKNFWRKDDNYAKRSSSDEKAAEESTRDSERKRRQKEQEVQKKANHKEVRERELIEKGTAFMYLSEDTMMITKGIAVDRLTPERLVEKWSYALEVAECSMLKQKFTILADQYSDSSLDVLTRWLGFLKEEGVSAVNGDENYITVGVDNRYFYTNGTEFKDGTKCRIEEHPWLLRGELYYAGKLAAAEDDCENKKALSEEKIEGDSLEE